MAKKLSKGFVTNGNLIEVANIDRAPTALHVYTLLYVEDLNGRNERPLLLTRNELNRTSRADIPGILVPGRLYPVTIYGRSSFAIKVVDIDKKVHILLVSQKKIDHWTARANRNPEDIPTKNWLIDLMD